MRFIKQILFQILGVKNYLIVVSKLFFLFYFLGWLRNKKDFKCHYFINRLIKKGDYVIDIGANLGYFSRLFGKLTGSNGKVFSVEPVSLFREILYRNTFDLNNIVIIPYALGREDNKSITMGIPKSNKYLRHGLTRVLKNDEKGTFEYTFNEKMMSPITLFGQIDRCDYIKCDVEGYEINIIPQLDFLLKTFTPIIQIEVEPANRILISEYLLSYSYFPYYLNKEQLYPLGDSLNKIEGDLFYLPKSKIDNHFFGEGEIIQH